jgi:hypothetical protein
VKGGAGGEFVERSELGVLPGADQAVGEHGGRRSEAGRIQGGKVGRGGPGTSGRGRVWS